MQFNEIYNGGGVETVLSAEEQAEKSRSWQDGYTLGITEGYDSLEEDNPFTGLDASDWDEGRSQGLADIYKME